MLGDTGRFILCLHNLVIFYYFYILYFFTGYLPHLTELLNYKTIKDNEDDQLYYTLAYLNDDMRNSLKINLDHKASIFQNLNGALCK